MALDPGLLDVLACPSDDHAPLRLESRDGADTLVCTFCATRFRIEDDIPVLLLDEAEPGPHGPGRQA